MKIVFNKKVLFSLLITFIISCLFNPSKCYAQTDPKVTIGEEISNTSLETDIQYYTLTLKRKMKIEITVSVEAVNEQTAENTNEEEEYYTDEDEDYYYEFDEESNTIDISINDEYDDSLLDIREINAGETKTNSVVLDAGTYTICIYGNSGGLKYTFNTEDITVYTKKISMVSKLSLFVGNSKKLTVKSTESGKSVGEVIWTTSNEKVAKVDSSGKVTGIKQGTCVISAKTINSNTVKCKVTIKTRPQLYITDASFDINFVGGVEPYITFQNNFGKTIKYIDFYCYFYNTVNDPAYCEIQNTNYKCLEITGPIKNKCMDSYYWDAVIYNNATGKMYIKSAKIIFMDGTAKTVSIKKSYK